MSGFANEAIMRPLRVLLTGGQGMLGSDVHAEMSRRGWHVIAPSIKDFDVTYMPHLQELSQRGSEELDVVVNCAAYTSVDHAETEQMVALKVNGVAPGALAAICKLRGWRMVHVSTDFVFDGQSDVPYTETSLTVPLGSYGRSKLLGEQNALKELSDCIVLRTAWLYGAKGKCFPRTMIDAWTAGKELKVVADQTGSPTSTVDLARVLCDGLEKQIPGGIYHAAGREAMTWHQLAVATLEQYKLVSGEAREVKVLPVPTSEWPTPATRPKYSVLDCSKLAGVGIDPMRPTKEALAEFCQRLWSSGEEKS